MRIAVVDDERTQTDLLAHMARRWGKARGERVDIQAFDSAEAFLFAWNGDQGFDVALLDIQMKAMNGMQLAHAIRAQGSGMPIVFITGVADHMAGGYDVGALHYLMKPVDEDKLFACLDRAAERTEAPSVLIGTDRGSERFLVRGILWVEAFAHTTAWRMDGRQVISRHSIGEAEAMLGGHGFCRCHRSYLVNLARVARLERDALVLDGGEMAPVSRRARDDVRRAFFAYHRERHT